MKALPPHRSKFNYNADRKRKVACRTTKHSPGSSDWPASHRWQQHPHLSILVMTVASWPSPCSELAWLKQTTCLIYSQQSNNYAHRKHACNQSRSEVHHNIIRGKGWLGRTPVKHSLPSYDQACAVLCRANKKKRLKKASNFRTQKLCEGWGGCPGLLITMVSLDVK